MFKNYSYLFLILLLTFVISLNGQEELSSFNIKLESPNQIEPLVVVDSKENAHFFYVSKDQITHVIHNVKTETYSKKEYSRPNSQFPKLHGFSINQEDDINLFFSNYLNNSFLLMSINENSDSTYAKRFHLEFDKKERFLETINHNHQFHLLTYVKGTSIIKRYTFNKERSTSTVYDLSKETFRNSINKKVNLSNIISTNNDCSIIVENTPLSIEMSAKKLKIYPNKNEILLSFNHRLAGTRIVRLSLKNNNFQSTFHIAFSQSVENKVAKKSNSFILENRLYHLSVSKDTLVFTIDNLVTNERLTTKSIGKNEEIAFKNGQIYELGDVQLHPFTNRSVSKRKSISKTKEFLRKLSKSDIGIHVNNKGDISDINIGGVKEAQKIINASDIVIASIGVAGSIMTPSVMPIGYSYKSYVNSRSVYFKSLLNKNTSEHITGDSPNLVTNVFDKISMRSRYLKNSVLKKRLAIETIFKMNKFFVYGYYNKKEKTYNLFKFN